MNQFEALCDYYYSTIPEEMLDISAVLPKMSPDASLFVM